MKTNKIINSLLLAGVIAVNSSTAFASTLPTNVNLVNEQSYSDVTLKSDQQSVDYTNFIKNGGGEQWVKLTLDGAKFNTNDPYEIKNAISQNYDITTSLLVGNDGKSIEFGVYEPNAGISYLPNWEITIDSSVLTSDTDATIKIPVNYDMNTSTTPKVITSKQSVTINELKNGFTLSLTSTGGAVFNTNCLGNNIRLSLMQTANIPVYALTYCDLDLTNVSFFIKALNDIPDSATEFTFRLEQERNAVLSSVPLIVKIPIVR